MWPSALPITCDTSSAIWIHLFFDDIFFIMPSVFFSPPLWGGGSFFFVNFRPDSAFENDFTNGYCSLHLSDWISIETNFVKRRHHS